jgi:hypothetical protein
MFGAGQIRVLQFLKEHANAEGECSYYVQEIAKAAGLSRKYVSSVITRFVKMGLISRQQTFDIFEDCAGTEAAYPDKNLYRILQPELIDTILVAPADQRYYVNLPEQLWLPFPAHEKTILAYRARSRDPFFAPAGASR